MILIILFLLTVGLKNPAKVHFRTVVYLQFEPGLELGLGKLVNCPGPPQPGGTSTYFMKQICEDKFSLT